MGVFSNLIKGYLIFKTLNLAKDEKCPSFSVIERLKYLPIGHLISCIYEVEIS